MSKFGDKFLDMMHLNNDYEDDYEDDYNEDDYEDDDRPARSYKPMKMRMLLNRKSR